MFLKPASIPSRTGRSRFFAPYDVLDNILDQFILGHKSAAEIIASGHESGTVERVTKLVTRAEFKRKQAAPGLKVTDRAFGTGWRMPIASRQTL
jgi:NH3-dependent NAD+ synthetase